MDIRFVSTDEEIMECRDVILDLRPHIKPEDYPVAAKSVLGKEVWMIGLWHEGKVCAAAVYRLGHYFYRGQNIYIDDLNTLPTHRGKGYGSALLDFIIAEAHKMGCANIHLDSGYQQQRYNAHRLYLNKGFHLASHHFVLDL